jgi:hypothetical protein
MKKTTTGKQNKPAADPKTGGKDLKTEQKKTKKKSFNGFKTEGPKTTKKKKAERILIDVSSYPKDEDGHAIIPDDLFTEKMRNLPDGTRSESGRIAHRGGELRPFGTGTMENEDEIRRQGGIAHQAQLKQRKTLAESIEIALRKKASNEDIDKYGLPADATNQDVITAAIVRQAGGGNMKAWTALRDTVGEMPVARTEITADVMTAADRALVEKLSRRLDSQ